MRSDVRPLIGSDSGRPAGSTISRSETAVSAMGRSSFDLRPSFSPAMGGNPKIFCTVGRRRSASMSNTRLWYEWLSVSARFTAVRLLPSPGSALAVMMTLMPRSFWAWCSVAASFRYCSRAAGENPSVPSSLPTSCGSVRQPRSSFSGVAAAMSGVSRPGIGVHASMGRDNAASPGRGATALGFESYRGVGASGAGASAAGGSGNRTGVRLARCSASASRVMRAFLVACQPYETSPAARRRSGIVREPRRRNRNHGRLRGRPCGRPAADRARSR